MVFIKEGIGGTAAKTERPPSKDKNGCRSLGYCLGRLLRYIFPALVVIIILMMLNHGNNPTSASLVSSGTSQMTAGAPPPIRGQLDVPMTVSDHPSTNGKQQNNPTAISP
jgi:hypothetical protein